MNDDKIEWIAGYAHDKQGRLLCPGVICNCHDKDLNFCPMHGKRVNERNIHADSQHGSEGF